MGTLRIFGILKIHLMNREFIITDGVREMGFSTKIMIVATALCVPIWVLSLIKIVLNLAIAPKFGFRCSLISGFGFLFVHEEGKWRCKKDKFSPIIQEMVGIDISQPIPEDIDRKERVYTWISYAVEFAAALGVAVLFSREIKALLNWKDAGAAELFLGAFAVGMLFHSLSYICMGIYTYGILMKRLAGYVDVMLKKMRQGVSFEAMNLKPVSLLPYKNPTKLEKMTYYQLYIPYLISVGDVDGLKEPIGEMTDYYAKRDYFIQETLSYYWLIFYYSRYEINPANADAFFERVSATLMNDTDANAKRVLAYYCYGVKNDIERAGKYVREGLAVVDKFSLPGAERELERKLLLELDEIISKRMLYGQGNN